MPRGLAAVVVWPPIESETIKILGLASNQTLAADLASGVAAVGVWPPIQKDVQRQSMPRGLAAVGVWPRIQKAWPSFGHPSESGC